MLFRCGMSIRFQTTRVKKERLSAKRKKKEQEEIKRRREEKDEAHLYTVIKVARDEDLVEQIGRDIYFDLVDHEKVRSFRVLKQTAFNVFKKQVAKEFGVPVQSQRFWLWAKRKNYTYRPHRPITPEEEKQPVGQLRGISDMANNAELKLFLEVKLGPDLLPVPPPEKTEKDILLFFKLYDSFKEELRYVGRMFVRRAGTPMEVLAKINKLAGFSTDEEIELYEELKFEPNVMCDHIDKKLTFRASLLEDGDIICFQKSSQVGSRKCRFSDVPSFLKYVHNRQAIESEDTSEQDMDTFFTSLESKLVSSSFVPSREEAMEALAKIDEVLNMVRANIYDLGMISSLKKAFKVLYSSDCYSTLTIEQKSELLAMEDNFKQLTERAVKAVKNKNLHTERESVKLKLSHNLELSLTKFKETKTKMKQVEQKIATLLEQVDEAQKTKENILAEQKEIFKSSQDWKVQLDGLGKEWPDYVAEGKVAEEEERTVEAELCRMKDFVSSLRSKVLKGTN